MAPRGRVSKAGQDWQAFPSAANEPEAPQRSAASLRAQSGWGVALLVAGIFVGFFGFQFGLIVARNPTFLAGTAVLGLAAIVAGAILFSKAKAAMSQLWSQLAAHSGWSYIEKDKDDLPYRYSAFKPFGVGGARFASNVLRGEHEGTPFNLFTYQYTVSSGKHSQTYFWTVAWLRMPIDAPKLSIQREHAGHKIFDALGGEDIDIESDEFSRRYWVRCYDRKFAYDVLHAPIVEYLLEADDAWYWQWYGTDLVAYRRGGLKLENVDTTLGLVSGFRSRLPRHLLQGSGFKPGRAVRAP